MRATCESFHELVLLLLSDFTAALLVPGLYCAAQARSLVKDYTATDFVQSTMLTLAPARL